MSGGQDWASGYIQTGGTNVFKKTERTKCGNCVFWVVGERSEYVGCCHRFPANGQGDNAGAGDWCGEFVDREPSNCCRWNPDKDAMPEPVERLLNEVFRHRTNVSLSMLEGEVAKIQERVTALEKPEQPAEEPVKEAEEVKDKPAELREWWCVVDRYGDVISVWPTEHCAVRSSKGTHSVVHVRQVPSPERVREALDEFVENFWELKTPTWEGLRRELPNTIIHVENLLRSLGHDTEGL